MYDKKTIPKKFSNDWMKIKERRSDFDLQIFLRNLEINRQRLSLTKCCVLCILLQKYRSHRKHMLAREAEAASWTQRRHAYAAGGPAGAAKKQETSMWTVPTIGFSPSPAPLPPPPPPPHPAMQHFARPLHVWGHPSTDPHSPRVAVWPPRHPATPRGPVPPPPPSWAAPPPPFWHHPYMRVSTLYDCLDWRLQKFMALACFFLHYVLFCFLRGQHMHICRQLMGLLAWQCRWHRR